MEYLINIGEKKYRLQLPDRVGADRSFIATLDGKERVCRWHPRERILSVETPEGELNLSVRNFHSERFSGEPQAQIWLEGWIPISSRVTGVKSEIQLYAPGIESRKEAAKNAPKGIRSPMTGKLLKTLVKAGDLVEQGQAMAIVEAMKMENKIFAPFTAKIALVKAKEGQAVSVGQELFTFEI